MFLGVVEFVAKHIGMVFRIGAIAVIGFPFIWFFRKWAESYLEKRLSRHVALILSNIFFYGGLALVIVSLLNEVGFKLSALVGAAGVIGIAIGFAAQTSVSNIISGIFLLAEQPFKVGDMLATDKAVGKVESIDLLSVKIRTLDNTLVRVPNELLLKNVIINRTYYSHYRLTFEVGLPVEQDATVLMDWVKEIIGSQKLFLPNPQSTLELFYLDEWVTTLRVRAFVKHKDIKVAAGDFIHAVYVAAQERGILISVARTDIK